MSKIDRVKEEIGLLKLFLAGHIAIDVSLDRMVSAEL